MRRLLATVLVAADVPAVPAGPACRDSSLVLPIGPLDRAQAEQQIRSFEAKGRTPIAYALERAAEDLGTSGPRTSILVSPSFDIPDRQYSSSSEYPFQRRGFVDGLALGALAIVVLGRRRT